ncbi:hypothetical protein ACU58_03320 [Escherichia coli]|nr:hypothetical protein ACU58_03320 [Escherichia coli]
MLPSETMIWQPEFTDKTLSRKPGAVHNVISRYYAAGLPAAWNRPGYFKLRWLINRADPKVRF